MQEEGLIKPADLVDLNDLYSCFGSLEDEVDADDGSETDEPASET